VASASRAARRASAAFAATATAVRLRFLFAIRFVNTTVLDGVAAQSKTFAVASAAPTARRGCRTAGAARWESRVIL
jgi:hypothetical protein